MGVVDLCDAVNARLYALMSMPFIIYGETDRQLTHCLLANKRTDLKTGGPTF
jgi:hypothetical protein